MCLVIKKKKAYTIAKEPIKVYKVMFSSVSKCRAKKEGTYDCYFPCVPGGANIGDTVKATSNSEPYRAERTFYTKNGKVKRITYLIKDQGVHAYKTEKDAKKSALNFDTITEWEIPAGAKYWESYYEFSGEIAATEMNFKRIILKIV